MKKLFSIFIVISLILSFSSCLSIDEIRYPSPSPTTIVTTANPTEFEKKLEENDIQVTSINPTECDNSINYNIKYIFLFIGDGMGDDITLNANQLLMAQSNKELSFINFENQGEMITTLESGAITDSGAAATAMATGEKTYSSAVGVDIDGNIIENIIEYLEPYGIKSGIITTDTIDGATPAGFYAHQKKRSMYDEIIEDIFTSPLNQIAGGYTNAGKSESQLETLAQGTEFEINIVDASDLFLSQKGVYLADIPYANDNDGTGSTLYSLLERTVKNLYSEDGFFIMAEGAKIDWAQHNASWADAIRELYDLNDAIEYALDFYNNHPNETLIIVTADHETGGYSYDGYPNVDIFNAIEKSYSGLQYAISQAKGEGLSVGFAYLKQYLNNYFGFKFIDDTTGVIEISDTSEDNLYNKYKRYYNGAIESGDLVDIIMAIINNICGDSYSTTGHSKENVPIYAIGRYSELFKDTLDNTDIFNILQKIIKLEY